jgi:hypothetical protein
MESNYGQNRRTARTFALSLTMIVLNGPTRGSLSVSKYFFFIKTFTHECKFARTKEEGLLTQCQSLTAPKLTAVGIFFFEKSFEQFYLFVCLFVRVSSKSFPQIILEHSLQ